MRASECEAAGAMKPHITYEFHYMGIPTSEERLGEIFSPVAGMFTSDNPGRFRIQWHRFLPDSPLHPLIKTLPHVAFEVDDLTAAIEGEELILGPYEPIDGFLVAIINDAGVPVELIQTTLSDDEIWGRARRGEGALYRAGESVLSSSAQTSEREEPKAANGEASEG